MKQSLSGLLKLAPLASFPGRPDQGAKRRSSGDGAGKLARVSIMPQLRFARSGLRRTLMSSICAHLGWFLVVVAMSGSATTAQEKVPEKPPADPVGVLTQTVEEMKSASGDLRKRRIRAATLKSQAEALAHLDQLIQFADRLPKATSQPSQPRPGENQSKSPSPGDSKQPQKQSSQNRKGSNRRTDQGPQNSTSQVKAAGGANETPAAKRRVIVKQIWGHLPPAMQRHLMSVEDEKPLPKYQRLVEKYFEAVAEASRTRPKPRGK